MGVTLEDSVVQLDVLCGIDALFFLHQPTVILFLSMQPI